MPSILTLEGPGRPRTKARKRRKKTRAERGLETPEIGFCKRVDNPRTKVSLQLCYVGKSNENPTGWRFKSNNA